ncbi:hypothetical protein BSKO_13873 [Bryopsis sp. KO-2023]|nr:hypothetical protein BSKO_13873 [Bryopsis sp. KO-2023]
MKSMSLCRGSELGGIGAKSRVPRCKVGRTLRAGAVSTPEAPSTRESPLKTVKESALITAIKTPYLESGRFDLDAFDALVEEQINNGVEGLIIGGTTGEGHLMSWDEHIMLIAHTTNIFRGRVNVIGNTGSNSTHEAWHATEQGFNVGMDASLQINPYYGKTSIDGLTPHFKVVLDEGPAMIYNVPGRTGQDIPDEVIMSLASHPNFLGVKECTGNERIANYQSQNVSCWSGNDDEAHEGRHKFGSAGVVSVTSNLIPGLFSKLMHGSADYELAESLNSLMGWLFCEPNPIAVNTALAMCGLVKPVFRLPYVPLSKEKREEGAKLLEAVKEHIPGCKEVRVMEDDEFSLLTKY